MSTSVELLTIGHSSLPYERFLELLRQCSITAVADVRSTPYSRHSPQYNRNNLKDELRKDGVAYVFLGQELGGRPQKSELFCEGVADYEKMARVEEFQSGLDRLLEGSKKYRLAMMCSEQNPLDCHRCLLVGRAAAARGITVGHILQDGQIVRQEAVERQLLAITGKQNDDMFASRDERLSDAYRERARKVAFAESEPEAAAE